MNIAVNKKLILTSIEENATTKANPLGPFKDIIGFYCENHTTDINVLRGKMPSFCCSLFASASHTILS
jgi:hypothetical protein